ncbi:hypothetical protein ABMA75_03190 [Halobacteriovorax sp. ZH4_bin.1]|uniref:hypothetical protein n=1 Tax=unclassified Halobacteriovorax TaxID=2639665 RepID=UPI003716C131
MSLETNEELENQNQSTNESTKKNSEDQLKNSINEFISEASEENEQQAIKTDGLNSNGEAKTFKRIDIFEMFDFVPPNFISVIVSPSKSLLKTIYLKKLPKDTQKEVDAILTDDATTIERKKALLNKMFADYCIKHGIDIENFEVPDYVKWGFMEIMPLFALIPELEGYRKEAELLNSKGKDVEVIE